MVFILEQNNLEVFQECTIFTYPRMHLDSRPIYMGTDTFKGALDKYNIYLFVFFTKEDFKLNQYRNFQLIILLMRFHFMRYFVNSIIFRVSHRLLYHVFIEVDFEK